MPIAFSSGTRRPYTLDSAKAGSRAVVRQANRSPPCGGLLGLKRASPATNSHWVQPTPLARRAPDSNRIRLSSDARSVNSSSRLGFRSSAAKANVVTGERCRIGYPRGGTDLAFSSRRQVPDGCSHNRRPRERRQEGDVPRPPLGRQEAPLV